MEIFEIVKIFDGVCSHNDDNNDVVETHFRLEVLQTLGKQVYMGKVYRIEVYRLQPTFSIPPHALSDCENDAFIFVADDTFNFSQLNGTSIKEILAKFDSALEKAFR